MTTVTTHSTRNGSATRPTKASLKDTNPTRVLGVPVGKGVRKAAKAAKESAKAAKESAKINDALATAAKQAEQDAAKLEADAKKVQADAKAVKAAAKKIKAGGKAKKGDKLLVTDLPGADAGKMARAGAVAIDPDSVEVTRDMTVRVLVKENPKTGKRAERFAKYVNGMTVANYVSLGGKLRDVRWDVAHGYVAVAKP